MTVIFRWLLLGGCLLTASLHAHAHAQTAADNQVFTYVEQMPVFPGGQPAMFQTLGQTLIYPTEALQQRLEGQVFVGFVVGTTGKVLNAKAVRSLHPLLDAEAVRAVSNLPDFLPGKQNGRPVAVAFTIPIKFKLPADVAQLLAERANPSAAEATAEYARFPGGPAALLTYLAAAPYPKAARASQAEGRVFVRFEVSPEGKVEKAAAIQPTVATKHPKGKTILTTALTTNPLLLKAAEALVAAMPAWQPATREGQPATSSQIVPVDFHLMPLGSAPVAVYAYADQMPVFVGVSGELPLQASIQRASRYTAEALRSRAQGQMLVYFVVNEQGQVEQAEVIRSVHPSLDVEVLNVVRNQRASTPAMHQGKPVKVFYVQPLTFTIR